MSTNRVIGAQPPPRHPVPTYQVLRVQKHGPLDLTILADTVFAIATHYVLSDEGGYGTTQVCWQHERECPYHDEREEWAGFLPVWDHVQRKRAVLRLAPREYDEVAKVLGLDLRWGNVRVKLTPTNAGKGKSVHVEKQRPEAAVQGIGPHDMGRTICLVFGIDHIPRQTPCDPPGDEEVRGL